MIVTIELEDPTKCNGCPILDCTNHEYPAQCGLDYFNDDYETCRGKDSRYERPIICKMNHGE
uniref:Uncharacterized protein n=1 Tax=viral metagenome TaxID=1070528 RepID=A0A6M3LUR5_9ZZZZ